MDSTKLTPQQRDRLVMLLSRHRDGLNRLKQRMIAVGWPTIDSVYCSVLAAEQAIQSAISALPARPLSPDTVRLLENLQKEKADQ